WIGVKRRLACDAPLDSVVIEKGVRVPTHAVERQARDHAGGCVFFEVSLALGLFGHARMQAVAGARGRCVVGVYLACRHR
ncbi:hypothetical protein ABTK10_21255, partial [Acinetobacter baumannii]